MSILKSNFILLLFLLPAIGFGQTPNTKRIENLKKRIEEAPSFEKKIYYISNLSSYYMFDLGDTTMAKIEAKRCIELSQAANYPAGIAAGISDYGFIYWIKGDAEKARVYFDSCHVFCEKNKSYSNYYYSNCMSLADYHYAVGNIEQSEKFIKIAIQTPDTSSYNLKLSAYFLLSTFAGQRKNDVESYNYLQKAILLNRKHHLKDPQAAFCMYDFLSKKGENKQAFEYLFEAEKYIKEKNEPQYVMTLEEYKGRFQSSLHNYEQALQHFKSALALAKRPETSLYVSRIKISIGIQLNKLGRHNEALNIFSEALANSLNNNELDATQAYIGIAESHFFLRQYDKAYQNINKGLAFVNPSDTSSVAEFYYVKAKTDEANQKNNLAVEGFKKALSIFQREENNDMVVEVATELSNCFQKIGETKEADFYFQLSKNYQDSLISTRNNIARIMLEENEKIQKAENENVINNDLSAKTTQRNMLIGLSVALCLALVALGIWQAQKRKATRKRYQETLKNYQTTIESYDKTLASLNYNIAHDLRRPLINAEMSIQNLKKDIEMQNNKNIESDIEKLDDNLKNMQGMIGAMLKLANIENHEIDNEEVDLNNIVNAVLANNQTQIEAQDIKIQVGTLPKINADPYLMFQVFDNLIANAIKFSKSTEPNSIEISGNTDTDHTVILVKDNGVGFDDKQKEYIFEPFKRLANAKSIEGSGIGLSIVKNIIEKYNGQIQPISSLNNGTTFYIRLPFNS
jgi:signal transduction histidine kinase